MTWNVRVNRLALRSARARSQIKAAQVYRQPSLCFVSRSVHRMLRFWSALNFCLFILDGSVVLRLKTFLLRCAKVDKATTIVVRTTRFWSWSPRWLEGSSSSPSQGQSRVRFMSYAFIPFGHKRAESENYLLKSGNRH